MTDKDFKAFTLQLLSLLDEDDANSQIFAYYSNPNNPERKLINDKIYSVRRMLSNQLASENIGNEDIVKAIFNTHNGVSSF